MKEKINTILVNQVNNVHRKTFSDNEDKLILVTGKDISYAFFYIFLLRPGRI